MATVTVRHVRGDRFEISTRGHTLLVDQPVRDGGEDTAPTPTEMFISSLASCVAFYARRFLVRHDLPTQGLRVTADWSIGGRPARVGDIVLSIQLPDGVPDDRRGALLAVASHCTVHNTLTNPPDVAVHLADARHLDRDTA